MLRLIALLPVLIWLYLLIGRGGFWRMARQLALASATDHVAASVVAVVPARNEAQVIGAAVQSLLRQQFRGRLHVIVVDDGSDDGTAGHALAAAAAAGGVGRLTVIDGTPPPADWRGKLWAMAQGAAAAQALAPDFLLFTDADIQHAPRALAALVANAEAQRCDLLSCMVQLQAGSKAERWLIPAFVFLFFLLYPPAWVASGRRRTAAAAGGCMLMRPAMLERIGGLTAIRGQIIDDCALARAVKSHGGRLWLGLTRQSSSLRPYGSAASIGQMISRTAFNQLHHSYTLLLATLVGLFLTYELPLLLLFSSDTVITILGLAALALMSLTYLPTVRFYKVSACWALALPAVALFYAAATMHSALQYARGRGGRWKGRAQDGRVP
ncbi:MAG TPA: glycosyltransferase [Steroidobacteraceae bacterium]|jgi:hopene-associated glycosyltransferase HpnB